MAFGFFKTKVHSTRHYVSVMAFAVVLALILGFGIWSVYSRKSTLATYQSNQLVTSSSSFARSNPIRLQIPALTIDTSFVAPLGLELDRTVSVPDSYTQVGWYEGGSTPGEIGPAVILGHVDSLDGPAVFYSLGQLKVGEEILVTRDDDTIAIFTVTKIQRYLQSDFPTLDVYGPTNSAELRLVTCSGLFNKSEQRYSHNLVVFATLTE